jgi:hypothetical protein
MIADKICAHHLERKAILYVRQSSPHQVLHNRESGALQYAMRDRLTALGFAEIEVIDDDLGRSAAGGVQRAGFERMVAEVRQGRRGLRSGSLALRPQQPGLATADRDVSRRRYSSCRSRDDLRAQARQRPTAVGAQGKSQRVRA